MTDNNSVFTGTLLPVFFISDMTASVCFYRDICGFTLLSVHDDETNREVAEWPADRSPWFIRMAAGSQEFALHTNNGVFDRIGGTKHYFEVSDVDEQYQQVVSRGGQPDGIQDFPWMRLFSMEDPDGHVILFQTPNSEWKKPG